MPIIGGYYYAREEYFTKHTVDFYDSALLYNDVNKAVSTAKKTRANYAIAKTEIDIEARYGIRGATRSPKRNEHEENLRGTVMAVSYKKLWKLLIDRDLLKRDLCKMANVSTTTMAKLGKGESVNLEILIRICGALEVDISDIMEVVSDKSDFE